MEMQIRVRHFCALLTALLISGQAGAEPWTGPRLEFSPRICDIGVLVNTNVVRFAFVFTNSGSERLTIGNISLCCGADMKLSARDIDPGSSAVLDVSMPLMSLSGPVDRSFYIHSNDPVTPIARVKIKGIAVSLVELRPEQADFGDIGKGEVAERIVDVVCLSNIAFRVTNTTSTAEGFSVSVDTAPGGKRHTVSIKTGGPAEGGIAAGKVILWTDHPGYSRLEIPVAARVAGVTAKLQGGGQAAGLKPVVIDYFYQGGCADCRSVSNEVIPVLEMHCRGFYSLVRHDVGTKSNYLKLVWYQERLGIRDNASVCMIVDGRFALNGLKAIKEGVVRSIEQAVQDQLAGKVTGNRDPALPPADAGGKLLEDRVKRFTIPAVLGAGLADGLNPCAFSTLVFFMSLLAVARVRGRGLLLMGVSFCIATFATYTALGFGILKSLQVLAGFEYVRVGIEVLMAMVLLVLAFLSFRDAVRFRRSGKASDITLQVPERVRTAMHGVMRRGIGSASLLMGGLLAGSVVTLLESVCTGQLYIPTLALVISDSGPGAGLAPRAWACLLAYNVMFVLPLVVVFTVTYFGMRMETLLRWSRYNVVASKILLGLLFVTLTVLMIVMG